MFSFGHYEDCLDTPEFSYNLLTLGIGESSSGMYIGMCLPKSCTHDIASAAISQALAALQLPFNVFSLETTIQDYQFPYTWVFILVCLILCLFTLLVCAGSIFKPKLTSLKGFDIR